MKHEALLRLTRGAAIAALYAALTVALQPISYGIIQFRVSEALTLLPILFPEAVWGLTAGCLLANIFGGSLLDIVVGTLATFLAAVVTRKMKSIWLAPLPVIGFNALLVAPVVVFSTVATSDATVWVYLSGALSIACSEAVITYIGGIPVLVLANKLFRKK